MVGAINAYHALLAERAGYRALYLSGGGVAAGSLGVPDLGISTLDDVLTDVRRITDVCALPLLVDVDTGFGGAFNIARTVALADQGRRGGLPHRRPGGSQALRPSPRQSRSSPAEEMVDRIKAAVDARTDPASSSWRAPMRWPAKA